MIVCMGLMTDPTAIVYEGLYAAWTSTASIYTNLDRRSDAVLVPASIEIVFVSILFFLVQPIARAAASSNPSPPIVVRRITRRCFWLCQGLPRWLMQRLSHMTRSKAAQL